jgi:hypothetical protein
MARFSKDGRLIIPLTERRVRLKNRSKSVELKVRYIINEAFCPNGCNIMDKDHLIHNYPSLRIKFRRADAEGEFVISAIEGDFSKKTLSGELIYGLKDDLFCPHCDVPFKKLVNCHCQADAEMIVVGLTPSLDYNNAITFCNVTGCRNATFIQSGEAIKRLRLNSSY